MRWGELSRAWAKCWRYFSSTRAQAHLAQTVGRGYFPTDKWMCMRAFPTHSLTLYVMVFPSDGLLLFIGFPNQLSVTTFPNQLLDGNSIFSQHMSVGNAVSWCSEKQKAASLATLYFNQSECFPNHLA